MDLKDTIKKLHKGDAKEALIDFLSLAESRNYEIVFYVACSLMKLGYMHTAEIILLYLKDKDPSNLGIYNNLGYIYKQQIREDEAIEMFKEAEKGAPDNVDIINNIASMYVGHGTTDQGIEYTGKALALNENHASANWNRALVMLESGNYEEGWKRYDWGYKSDELGEQKRKNKQYYIDYPQWDGTKGQNVVVYGEQGIGDEIMFASMIPDILKDCNVIYDCHPRLADIMRNSFDIPVYGTRKDSEIEWPKIYPIDAKLALGSLGQFYRNTKESFPKVPYLKADPKLIQKYKKKLGPGMHVGVSWLGGTVKTQTHLRRIPLDIFKGMFVSGVNFISLQYNEDADKDAAYLGIDHWKETLDDYDETAGLINALDLIITVPQSIMHLAGSMGVPCWILTPFKHTWQMGVYGEDLPWYGSTKTYWQYEDENWEPIIKRVREDLCSLKNIAA